ncbi:hypothetical protein BM477_06715 [Boudabousia marimammalium]|uniref:Uncharacterized protein n=1 Tax=Boudabousia marimammalium TaxID=156892 RepID=A0A1Q5PL39_9ACTO|nr:hypothetical protein BM477_06715 [Boudabousia marimammalium]
MLGYVSEEVDTVRDASVDCLLGALITVVFKTDTGAVQSNHGTTMPGQGTTLGFHTIAKGAEQLRKVLARSGRLMVLRNKAQYQPDCIVDGLDAYRVEWFQLLRLVLSKIRMASNDSQPLDVLPFQFHVTFHPYDHTSKQREYQDHSETPIRARKQVQCKSP